MPKVEKSGDLYVVLEDNGSPVLTTQGHRIDGGGFAKKKDADAELEAEDSRRKANIKVVV